MHFTPFAGLFLMLRLGQDMNIMSPSTGYLLLLAFGVAMILVTMAGSRAEKYRKTQVGFLAAGRNVPWTLGAFSIAVSWIWAPALFVSVQQAYQQGIPGIFWFTFPNILCLFIMAPLALRIRRYLPEGYTQPEWIRYRFDERTHKMYLIPFFWYQLMAVTVQLYAGGSIFNLLTGVPLEAAMIIIAAFTLIYAVISGMRASVITDFLQYAMIFVGGLIVLPWTISAAGGLNAVAQGIGGVTGQYTNLFDAQVAFNFGIITSIGLISGVLSDQQHWQRAFTIEKSHLRRSYIAAGILFGIVPISLATLGFLAANPSIGVSLPEGVDPSMVGIAVVAKFLPAWAVSAFVFMLLAGLCSTLDSGMLAAASLYAVNCFEYAPEERAILKKRLRGEQLTASDTQVQSQLDKKVVYRSRLAMVGITLAGLVVAFAVIYLPGFGLKYLWWIFNTIAACVAVPTVLSLYWGRLSSQGVFWGVLTAFIIGIPVFIYGNYKDTPWISVAASVGIIAVTTIFALAFPRKELFKYEVASTV
jgi:urea-proton symporter